MSSWWRHEIAIFFRVTDPLSPVTGEFPLKRAGNADFDVSLMWVHTSSKRNSRMVCDLRPHDVHAKPSLCVVKWWCLEILKNNHLKMAILGILKKSSLYSRTLCISYRKVSNIRHTLAGNKIVDHSDVVGASPVGAVPTTSSFST